jgi:hypothetical protein
VRWVLLLCPSHLRLSLLHGKSGVVLRVRFIACPVLGNLQDDFFGIVTPREGTFGERPVVFGLT